MASPSLAVADGEGTGGPGGSALLPNDLHWVAVGPGAGAPTSGRHSGREERGAVALLRTSHLLSITCHLPAPRSPEPGCLQAGQTSGEVSPPQAGRGPRECVPRVEY